MKNSFSIKSAFLFAWKKFKENAPFLLGAFLIIEAVTIIFDYPNRLEISVVSLLLIGLAGFISNTILQMGVTRIVLNIHDEQEVAFENLIGETAQFLYFILAQLLVVIIIIIGSVLLIVPGIVAMVGLLFVPYIIIDKKLDPIEAIKYSWRLTNGYKWTLLFFLGISFILNMLGMLFFGIGLLVTMPITLLASVYAYRWLDKQDTLVVQSGEQEEETQEKTEDQIRNE